MSWNPDIAATEAGRAGGRIKIVSTLAMMGALRSLTELYESENASVTIDADFAPTAALVDRLRSGEVADIAILTARAIDDLTIEKIIRRGSRIDIALSLVGVAVKAGEPKPDISSLASFRATLLSVRSIAYSRIGASGIYFAEVIRRLGIESEVNAKSTIIASGFTAERVVSGEVALAVQQISELMVIPGIEIVGPLPAEIQTVATFSAGVLTESVRPEAASVIRFLASPLVESILQRAGLEPAGQRPPSPSTDFRKL